MLQSAKRVAESTPMLLTAVVWATQAVFRVAS